jgi:hypothetical protein
VTNLAAYSRFLLTFVHIWKTKIDDNRG